MKSVEMGGHKIALTMNAMVLYQEASGETFFDALAGLEGGSFDAIRLRRMIWALLGGETDLKAVGDIIDEVGIPTATTAIASAVSSAIPETSGKK